MDEPVVQKRYPDDFFAPLTVPFQQNESFLRTGVCALLSLVPILNLVYLTGYKHQVMIATANDDDIPPDPMNFSSIALSGLILTVLNIIFYLIPVVAMYAVGLSPMAYLFQFGDVLSGSLPLLDWIGGMIGRFVIVILWHIALAPIFTSAQMHYARGSSVMTFLNIPYHFFYVLRHISFFVKAEIFSWVFWALAVLMEVLVTPTGIGLVLWPPMVAAVYIISSGYEYGVKAQSI